MHTKTQCHSLAGCLLLGLQRCYEGRLQGFLPAADLHNQNAQGEEECHHWQEACPSVYRILQVLRMQPLAEAAAGDSQKTTESKGEVTPEIGPSKTARTSSKSASSNSKKLPLKQEQLSPKSKVLKDYGTQGAGAASRVLQKNDSGSGVVEINAVYSSPSLYELRFGEEGPPKKEDPPVEAGSRVPFKDYYDDGKGCKVRAYENGKIEEISVPDPVYVRHRSKQPPKKVKKSEKKTLTRRRRRMTSPPKPLKS